VGVVAVVEDVSGVGRVGRAFADLECRRERLSAVGRLRSPELRVTVGPAATVAALSVRVAAVIPADRDVPGGLVDLDLYEPTRDTLNAVRPYLTQGSVLAFDKR
jgi:hypothetical protein